MTETAIQNQIRLAVGKALPDVRLFRNQVGTYQLVDGRWLSSGLAPGSSDLIGWRTIAITPNMVGKRIAQFVSIEVKRPTRSRSAEKQKQWLMQVNQSGGCSGIARDAMEAVEILNGCGSGI